ncbi:hypothetical protein PM082_012245 [Marasmius tenuissimus]|nr:hypothetical protein PM082_012245 [Marasmius tenuissimus]
MSEQKALIILTSSSLYILLQAVGLNPGEWKFTLYPQLLELIGLPFNVGSDGAGVVEGVGKEVTQFERGDRVLFQGWFSADYSTCQQYALALENMVAGLPSTISTLEVATIPLAVATAALGFALPYPAILLHTEPARGVGKLTGGLTGITNGLARLQKNQVSGVKLVPNTSIFDIARVGHRLRWKRHRSDIWRLPPVLLEKNEKVVVIMINAGLAGKSLFVCGVMGDCHPLLHLRTIISKPIPVPGSNEVLIKVQGVGLNPAEWKFALYPQILDSLGYPVYTGSDGVGVVEEVGSEVTELKKGDGVLFQGWFSADYTTFQQYALAQAKMVAKLPVTMSTLEAALLPMAVAIAAFGFCLPDPATSSRSKAAQAFDLPLLTDGRAGAGVRPFWEEGAKGLKSGQPIVVLGGSSSVGQLAIQIAVH